ncbi:hypothetical protein PTE_02887 [Photorhabdus khanii NC19]|uniref:Uncharacterized protein n=1 Tax=Photorhabdus khanii NC19 TaxID=1004151 RepID=W3V4R7_9GAMM|nr:hypothetical protein PTE_02887 [Photorhabdus khanii NC19]
MYLNRLIPLNKGNGIRNLPHIAHMTELEQEKFSFFNLRKLN